jgi:hypothetical protein
VCLCLAVGFVRAEGDRESEGVDEDVEGGGPAAFGGGGGGACLFK